MSLCRLEKSFLKRLTEKDLDAMYDCLLAHRHGCLDFMENFLPSDPDKRFQAALVLAIGFDCFKDDDYREHHGFVSPYDEIKDWICEYGELADYDGPMDYLSLFRGKYNEYVGVDPMYEEDE
jgi:hypothetical protein